MRLILKVTLEHMCSHTLFYRLVIVGILTVVQTKNVSELVVDVLDVSVLIVKDKYAFRYLLKDLVVLA